MACLSRYVPSHPAERWKRRGEADEDTGYHEYSFAYATMGKRLPTILGKAIDDVVRTLNEQVRLSLSFAFASVVEFDLIFDLRW